MFTLAFISAGCIYITATFLCCALRLLPSSGRRLHSYAEDGRSHIDRCYNYSKWPPFGFYFLPEPQARRPSIHSWPCLGVADGFPIDSIETLPIPAEFLASSFIFHLPRGPLRLRDGAAAGGRGRHRQAFVLCRILSFSGLFIRRQRRIDGAQQGQGRIPRNRLRSSGRDGGCRAPNGPNQPEMPTTKNSTASTRRRTKHSSFWGATATDWAAQRPVRRESACRSRTGQ